MIPSNNSRLQYNGNDAITSFAYGFPVEAKTELLVTKTDSFGVETTLIVDTDYTVNGIGSTISSNWTITHPVSGSPLPTGSKLTITPNLSFVQNADFPNGGGYVGENHEKVFDRHEIKLQQLNEAINRTVKVSVGSATDPDDLIADLQTAEANASASASAAAASAALATSAAAMSSAMPLWVTGTAYTVGAVVRFTDEKIYRCAIAHTSGTFATDLSASRWVELSPSSLSGSITTSGLTQSTGKILGRSTASTGAIEEITLGAGLSFSGTTLNASSSGKLAQIVTASTVTPGSTGNTIPIDDTIPQQGSEGAEVVSLSITPTNASSTIKITGFIPVCDGNAGNPVTAIYKDSISDAIAVAHAPSGSIQQIGIVFYESSGSTTARTYKLFFGSNSGTGYWLQNSGGRKYGGIAKAVLIAEEILP